MKLIFFDDYKLGVIRGDTVIDVSDAVQSIPHTGPHNLISGLIERFDEYRSTLLQASDNSKGQRVGQVKIRAPLLKPSNIDCMAVNYTEEGSNSKAPPINAFHKSPSSIIGDRETMLLPDVPANIFEGEAELALVIGKRAKSG